MENVKSKTSDREILMSRTLNAPVALLWEVWTKPEHIANWWGPNGFTNTINTMDIRPGGELELVIHCPDGNEFKRAFIFTSDSYRIPHFHISTLFFKLSFMKSIIRNSSIVFVSLVLTMKANITDAQTTGRYANVNGIKMYYELHGTGSPLVLL